MKYQDESTKVSIVSVSRLAIPLHKGQIVFKNFSDSIRVEPPFTVNITSSGRTTARFLSSSYASVIIPKFGVRRSESPPQPGPPPRRGWVRERVFTDDCCSGTITTLIGKSYL